LFCCSILGTRRPDPNNCDLNCHRYNSSTTIAARVPICTFKMKPTSPLSLLLFLQLHVATTAPTPALPSFPPDCARTSCAPSLRALLTIGKPSTPPTRINSNPHFPAHQLAVDDEDPYDEAFNNAPITPPIHVAPTEALFSDTPLESSYLRSLSNAATSPTLQHSPYEVEPHTAAPLPAKPTSALPKLRKEETKIYLASLLPASVKDSQGDEEESIIREGTLKRPSRKPCGLNSGRQYMLVKSQSIVEGRDYSDFMVVGIVVLFLVLVVLAEAAEKVGYL